MKHRTILSLCDFSGEWPKPYREAGYTVVQIDLKHGSDVRLMKFPGVVHGILAAPPCTVFASSGARWPRTDDDMREGLSVVDACLRLVAVCRPQWWALENPIGKLVRWLGAPQYRFNPCDFGDPYTKRTCLWGNFVAPLPLFVGENRMVEATEGSRMHLQYGGKSERTKTARSMTPAGFAQAFCEVTP